ncbi:Kelch repeat-containing protein [Colletotrichum tropicale]|nr:Kelch repeat-containing protein [Colletotrichum tropicale]
MNTITSDSPQLYKQSIWIGPSGAEFYTWAGQKSYASSLKGQDIWRFAADGKGGGKWSGVTSSTPITFQGIRRPMNGSSPQSRDTGYYFGGVGDRSNQWASNPNASTPTPGLISYNMTSGEIRNITSEFGQYGTFKDGSAHFLPFGDAGLLLFLGGQQAPLTLRSNDWWREIGFGQVTVFDIKNERWYTQNTTGSIPTLRKGGFCTIGVAGPNKTFEIFMYGGWRTQERVFSDPVYVLSLPGFRFFQASGGATANLKRIDHTCVVVGNRQMLSIGGLASLESGEAWTVQDPWPNGMGIFDMTEMRWKDDYNADAAKYESPSVVQQWYSDGGQNNVSWTTEDLKTLFSKCE